MVADVIEFTKLKIAKIYLMIPSERKNKSQKNIDIIFNNILFN